MTREQFRRLYEFCLDTALHSHLTRKREAVEMVSMLEDEIGQQSESRMISKHPAYHSGGAASAPEGD